MGRHALEEARLHRRIGGERVFDRPVRQAVEVAAGDLPAQELPPMKGIGWDTFGHVCTPHCYVKHVAVSEQGPNPDWQCPKESLKGVVLKGAPDSTMAPSDPTVGLFW
jgi:hypothetical protein